LKKGKVEQDFSASGFPSQKHFILAKTASNILRFSDSKLEKIDSPVSITQHSSFCLLK
jgi:hypothetical protein